MINLKMENRVAFDYTMLLLLVALNSIGLTAKTIHEFLGLMFLAMAVLHCFINRGAVKTSVKLINEKNISRRRAVLFAVNCMLAVLLLTTIYSGIMISTFIFRHLNIQYNEMWYAIHKFSATSLIGVAALHLLLHAKMIVSFVVQRRKRNIKAKPLQKS